MSTPTGLPQGFLEARQAMHRTLEKVGGHLSRKEVDFLFLLGAAARPPGVVLEIGSFQGRSTVVLALAARCGTGCPVVAVDPLVLTASSDADPQAAASVAAEFHANLGKAGVAAQVEFHQAFSQDLAAGWKRPIAVLWIDGDHSLEGARRDLRLFGPFLVPGGVVAFHDVLHRTPGPMRVFMEDVLLSPAFGACGLAGSIGWARKTATAEEAWSRRREKLRLWKRLARLLPLAAFKDRRSWLEKRIWRLRRLLTPHGGVDPAAWIVGRGPGRNGS